MSCDVILGGLYMNKNQKELMLKLADFLETIPSKKFDMAGWMYSKKLKSEDFKVIKTLPNHLHYYGTYQDAVVVEPLHCKTAGCALGWAATMPEFKKRGLKLVGESDRPLALPTIITKDGSVYSGFEVAEKLFGISMSSAEFLFTCHRTRNTPKAVAKRLRTFVNDQEK